MKVGDVETVRGLIAERVEYLAAAELLDENLKRNIEQSRGEYSVHASVQFHHVKISDERASELFMVLVRKHIARVETKLRDLGLDLDEDATEEG